MEIPAATVKIDALDIAEVVLEEVETCGPRHIDEASDLDDVCASDNIARTWSHS